jgi:uncharacterized protein YbjT (DUF2867 family)
VPFGDHAEQTVTDRRGARAGHSVPVHRVARQDDVEIVTGDFDRPDTIDAAMRGVETVLLVSPRRRQRGGHRAEGARRPYRLTGPDLITYTDVIADHVAAFT